ncbi:asparaginase [Paenibacillus camelliae]|uniref:asparaginase n=1 Tax=Paenibacillus camelliae TaxID=512410 RepID=UPI00204116D6|nr:asparaginase domain-containing protein [Paenibacillus camelliae]MCM3635529.1 asparaginase domain-containing protein [Paenibacillus camelliae]
MNEIMVVFTGGTIGSTRQGSAVDVSASGSYMIIDQFKEQYDLQTTFDTIQPLNILSENLIAQQWLSLAEQIKQIPQEQYKGIIVTHGSDTLAYSAAMLGYLLAQTKIPIVLIASNYPLEDERANGLRNFSEAVQWIETEAPPGVFVVYENDRGESQLYLATRLMQCEAFTDQFRSPYELTLGQLKQGKLIWTEDTRNPAMQQLMPVSNRWTQSIERITELADQIVYIKPYPGLNYELYQWGSMKPKAIVHDLYHSATACSLDSGPYSLPTFIRRCLNEGIDVFLTPAKRAEDVHYASTAKLFEAGAVLLSGMAPEAAMTKLMLGYAILTKHEDIVEFMTEEELYHELHRPYR